MILSAIIPTHAPRRDYLERTLAALRAQDLPCAEWEVLIVDNASPQPIDAALVNWHPHGRVISAPTLGLTHARMAGFTAARGDLLVWIDDDNLLAPDYLSKAVSFFASSPSLGATGGKSIPEYESPPPAWYSPDMAPIGCRDLGDLRIEARWTTGIPREYPNSAPIGAGMAIRKQAMTNWINLVKVDARRASLGRTGAALTSGEDNDINLTLLADGWTLSYEPSLSLTHLIPPRRLTIDYQRRIARATYRDFVRALALHGITPWPSISRWTVPLRKVKAWFVLQAWRGPGASIRWHNACGQIEGRAAIHRHSFHD